MINGSKRIPQPIRWAMVGGRCDSQIGYIHRSAALRDQSFALVAGAFDLTRNAVATSVCNWGRPRALLRRLSQPD